jgi:hypothetical protein
MFGEIVLLYRRHSSSIVSAKKGYCMSLSTIFMWRWVPHLCHIFPQSSPSLSFLSSVCQRAILLAIDWIWYKLFNNIRTRVYLMLEFIVIIVIIHASNDAFSRLVSEILGVYAVNHIASAMHRLAVSRSWQITIPQIFQSKVHDCDRKKIEGGRKVDEERFILTLTNGEAEFRHLFPLLLLPHSRFACHLGIWELGSIT